MLEQVSPGDFEKVGEHVIESEVVCPRFDSPKSFCPRSEVNSTKILRRQEDKNNPSRLVADAAPRGAGDQICHDTAQWNVYGLLHAVIAVFPNMMQTPFSVIHYLCHGFYSSQLFSHCTLHKNRAPFVFQGITKGWKVKAGEQLSAGIAVGVRQRTA
ncbi:MAG: hypothetical protein ACRENG_14600 [bacterium]